MTAGAVPYVIIALAVFGLVLMTFGFIVDAVLAVDNQMVGEPGLPYSQQRANTMTNLTLMFKGLGFTSVMAAGVFLIKNAIMGTSGGI
jgi:hypothetical protein